MDYSGILKVTISYQINNEKEIKKIEKKLGNIPIMVKSSKCYLEKYSPKELIKVGEDEHEFGGYFIINGVERVLRLLIANKRNFPLGMIRGSWTKETDYSDKGIFVRCVRSDENTTINVLHYLNHGTMTLSFGNPYKYKVPVIFILKALKKVNDKEILNLLETNNNLDRERVEISVRDLKKSYPNYSEQDDFLKHLGNSFKNDLFHLAKGDEDFSDEMIGQIFIDRWILIHLDTNQEKFDFIILMIKKLLKLTNNEILVDDQDSLSNQVSTRDFNIFTGSIDWTTSISSNVELFY
jgi:DNA-directed RNA polymerase I subunit RPA2